MGMPRVSLAGSSPYAELAAPGTFSAMVFPPGRPPPRVEIYPKEESPGCGSVTRTERERQEDTKDHSSQFCQKRVRVLSMECGVGGSLEQTEASPDSNTSL